MSYFKFIQKIVERHTLLSVLFSVILLLFFIPSFLTVASTIMNVIGVVLAFTSGYILFLVIARVFDSLSKIDESNGE